MNESLQTIAQALKAARKKNGLSQRQLSAKVGLPQSHISKIEKGAVDLQASSLIQLARVLNLELMLVPRPFILAVKTLIKPNEEKGQIPAYRLEEGDENG